MSRRGSHPDVRPGTTSFYPKDRTMRLITSSLRNQLFAGVAAVQIVFAIGTVVAIAHLSSLSSTLETGTTRVKMVDALGRDTYAMQGSGLMNTLNGGASASDHAGDVQQFASDLAAVRPHLDTPADRTALAGIERAFTRWNALDARAASLSPRLTRRRRPPRW